MAEEEPTPPPAEEQDDEENPELYPFVDAAAGGGRTITIRAGWADQESGEPRELAVNYNGTAGSPTAQKMFESALEWYRDTVTALVRAQANEEAAEAEDAG